MSARVFYKKHDVHERKIGFVVIRAVGPFPTEEEGFCECVDPADRMMLSGSPETVLIEETREGPRLIPMPRVKIVTERRNLVADGSDSVMVKIEPFPLGGLTVSVGGERRRIKEPTFRVRTARRGMIQIRVEDPYVRGAAAHLEGLTAEEMASRAP